MADDFAIVVSAEAARLIRLNQLRLARENFAKLEEADEQRQARAERLAAARSAIAAFFRRGSGFGSARRWPIRLRH